jgi:hypothetical protein
MKDREPACSAERRLWDQERQPCTESSEKKGASGCMVDWALMEFDELIA